MTSSSSTDTAADKPFDHKVVVITGAAGGIGRALAHEFAARGARLVLSDISADGLEQTARAVDDARVLRQVCDVTDATACQRTIDEVIEHFGHIDVLINNAGVSHRSFFEDTDPSVLEHIMEVNFWGAVRMTRAALDALLAARGHIAVISSVAGFAPLIGRTGYAASKHALHGFFESLASEIEGRGVGTTMVCPSFIDTALESNAFGADGKRVQGERANIGDPMPPEELAIHVADAIHEGRDRLLPTGVSRLSWWVSRLAPTLYRHLMRRAQQSEFPDRSG